MKEWQLILSAPMVLARRAGRKTQTRRLSLRWMNAQPGDRLWVRETWAHADGRHSMVPVVYRADGDSQPCLDVRWRPSIYMPRWACRDTPTVVSVRAEKLQDITEEDAIAEGVERRHDIFHPSIQSAITNVARRNYAVLWDEINGAKAPWKSNPLVMVITMTKEGVK